MQRGFLFIETNRSHPGIVRINGASRDPTPSGADLASDRDRRIRLILRFEDLDAASMHAHTQLRRRLIDVDARTYRTDLAQAMAALYSIQLEYREVFRDPEITPEQAAAIATWVAANKRRQALRDRLWQIVGGLGIGLLLLTTLSSNH